MHVFKKRKSLDYFTYGRLRIPQIDVILAFKKQFDE